MRIIGESHDGFRDLLDHDDQRARWIGELLVEIEPILRKWQDKMYRENMTIPELIEAASSASVSIGATLIIRSVKSADLPLAMRDYAAHVDLLLDDAVKHATIRGAN